ncbi:MAG: glycerophosphoryl diester phosphodiesterase [Pseudonocardiales bacterium]|nr:glycerophosphoryl diester phosphodiesterase [Pseudonocardia sp.]MDT7651815.1 glycerophosphoryl diester phosphodiesterase [Pseudonocardiales bacterium]
MTPDGWQAPRVHRHPYLDGPYPRAYAHRGWHTGDLAGYENTLAAFRRAVDEGFGYLELDVHASADGVPVVHHDATLDRTTDGGGPIAALPAAAIAQVRVNGREPIPLLEQVLTELPDTRITIELKSHAVVEPVLAVLDRTDSWHRVCLGSYHDGRLARARSVGGARLCTSLAQGSAFGLRARAWLDALPGPLSHLPAPPVTGNLAQLPRRFGALTVVDAALVRAAHQGGREVHVWTVDDPVEMGALLDLGVDGLLSDRPDLLREVLHSRGSWQGS